MAVTKTNLPTSVAVKWIADVVDGKQIYKTRSYGRIKAAATDANVYAAAAAIANLSDYMLSVITRKDQGNLADIM